jgi:hypothetical protein
MRRDLKSLNINNRRNENSLLKSKKHFMTLLPRFGMSKQNVHVMSENADGCLKRNCYLGSTFNLAFPIPESLTNEIPLVYFHIQSFRSAISTDGLQ